MTPKARHLPAILLLALASACSRRSDPTVTCPGQDDCRPTSAALRAHELHRGPRGERHGARPMAGPAGCTYGSGSLPDDVRDGIARALADERRSEATYAEVAKRVPGFPFDRIARAEVRHAAELERLLSAHGHPVPPVSPEPPQVRAETDDVGRACADGAASEKQNIALYDELLSKPLPPDVRCVFERLRAASATHHLPAFERCAARR